jgi:hypothetical protein
MSSVPLPDNSSITRSPEKPRRNVEHSTPPFTSSTTSEGKVSVGSAPELHAILEQAMAKTGATGAAIALTTGGTTCCRASTGTPAPEVGASLHSGISLSGLCLETGEILLCNDSSVDRRVDPQLCKEIGIRSVLVLPIKQNANVVGVLLLLSINRNAFNQHDAAEMSKLAEGILPMSSESTTTISHRCLDPFPSHHLEAERNVQKLFAHVDVLQDHTSRSTITEAAGAADQDDQTRSQLTNQPIAMTNRANLSAARWVARCLTAALVLVICGYGYHLNHRGVATNIATLPIEATNRKPAVPMSSERDKKIDGSPKLSQSVLTATRQDIILAIQERVQGAAVNRGPNRAGMADSVAQYEMGLRCARGEGVPQNYGDAMAWFAKAAASGNDNAEWKLGLGYIKGIGVPHDEREAVVWFKRAANHGDIRAQGVLSDLYLNGRGVPKDYVRAYTWGNIATGFRGDDNHRLKVIGSRMTPLQIEDAQRRILSWRVRQMVQAAPPVSHRIATPEVSHK